MTKSQLPKSLRKYIRQEKSRIRREVFDAKEQERLIGQLYQRQARLAKTKPEKNSQLSN